VGSGSVLDSVAHSTHHSLYLSTFSLMGTQASSNFPLETIGDAKDNLEYVFLWISLRVKKADPNSDVYLFFYTAPDGFLERLYQSTFPFVEKVFFYISTFQEICYMVPFSNFLQISMYRAISHYFNLYFSDCC
jgi:hypothetical protein